MQNYDTDDSRRRSLLFEEYQLQHQKLLCGELEIPGWQEMNYLDLAYLLCPQYAAIWERELNGRYGSLLAKG